MVVCISAYGENSDNNLGKLKNPSVEISASDSSVSGEFRLELNCEKTVEVLEFYRHKGSLKMKINGSGYNNGIEHLCGIYGVSIE